MNIRAVLGASRAQVLGQVVGHGSIPLLAGVGAGLAGAVASGRLVASLLFEVGPRDPGVLAAAAIVVGGVGVLACVVSALQALEVNPAAALRDE
jgi:putative ABC transport system permease protein